MNVNAKDGLAIATLAAALGVCGATASSPEPPTSSSQEPSFDAVDTDHDGSISHREAERNAWVRHRFAKLDVNHDGRITADEFGAAGAIKDSTQ
jgi:Ca2+-binding EF-hand superfamily protein